MVSLRGSITAKTESDIASAVQGAGVQAEAPERALTCMIIEGKNVPCECVHNAAHVHDEPVKRLFSFFFF